MLHLVNAPRRLDNLRDHSYRYHAVRRGMRAGRSACFPSSPYAAFHLVSSNMRTSALLAAFLATVVGVAAIPGGTDCCTVTRHKWKATKTATSTTYPSTITHIFTVSSGTSTSTTTTTSTPTSTLSCTSPAFTASKRDVPNKPHCWHTKTVTTAWGTTTTTLTVTSVSTVQSTSIVSVAPRRAWVATA